MLFASECTDMCKGRTVSHMINKRFLLFPIIKKNKTKPCFYYEIHLAHLPVSSRLHVCALTQWTDVSGPVVFGSGCWLTPPGPRLPTPPLRLPPDSMLNSSDLRDRATSEAADRNHECCVTVRPKRLKTDKLSFVLHTCAEQSRRHKTASAMCLYHN